MSRPTAAQVRATVAADKSLVKRLSPAAKANLTAKAGRLSSEVANVYNDGRIGVHRYMPGNSGKVATAKAAKAAKTREALRAKGVEVGARGPLPKPKPRAARTKA